MIRKFQPGYYVSDHQFGRSHYYASYKYIGNMKLKTWHFNLLIIMVFAFLFFCITLFNIRRI